MPAITSIVVIIAILTLTYQIFHPFFLVLITAAIFSIFLNPLFERLRRFLPYPTLAAMTTLIIFLCFILIPLGLLLTNVVDEAKGLMVIIADNPTVVDDLQTSILQLLRQSGLPVQDLGIDLQTEVVTFLTTFIHNIGTSLLSTGSFFLNVLFVLLTTFFFFLQKTRIRTYILQLHIIPTHYFTEFEQRTISLVNGLVRGNLLVALVQMLIGIIGFSVFSVPAPFLLAILYGIFSLVPNIGVLIIWLPMALILFISQGLVLTLLFLAWFITTNIFVDNFIAPRILGSQTNLHQLLIMFAVIGGLRQFGALGIVLGPVIVALAFVAIEMYKELVKAAVTSPE